MRQRTKELVWVLIVAAIIIALCALWDATHAAKVGGEWVPLGPFNGGINTTSNKGQLSPSEFVESENFVWSLDKPSASAGAPTAGHLEVREGFYRFGEPKSDQSVKFIDIFKGEGNAKYLLYSDGTTLWYRQNLTGAAYPIDLGSASKSVVDTWGTYVSGDSILVQKWLSTFGRGEGLAITIDGVDYVIDQILTDTSLILTSSAGTTSDKTYSISFSGLRYLSGYNVAYSYWLFSNAGKLVFTRPDAVTLQDTIAPNRFAYSTISQQCYAGAFPALKWNASGVSSNYANQYLRPVSNQISQGGTNPIPSGHLFFMNYLVAASGGNAVWTYGSAFTPDTTAAQYFTIANLSPDTSTWTEVTVDSIVSVIPDSLGCSVDGIQYVKIFCNSCNWETDTLQFMDHYVAPMQTEFVVNTINATVGNFSTQDTIRGVRITTPAADAVRAFYLRVGISSGFTGTANLKGAIYKVSDSTLVDTTFTASVTKSGGSVTATLFFPRAVNLGSSTKYFVAVWSGSNVLAVAKNANGLEGDSAAWKKADSYDGSFPSSIAGATPVVTTSSYAIELYGWHHDSLNTYPDYQYQIPIAAGYIAANGPIYAAVHSDAYDSPIAGAHAFSSRLADGDTCKIAIYKMTAQPVQLAAAVVLAVWHNSTNLEVRAEFPDRLYWSEVNQPDSFLIDHMMIVDHGNPLTAAGKQLGDVVFYTATNRWKIIYGGGGQYTKQFLDGVRGCVARRSFLDIEGVHYGLGADGYWESSGEPPQLISQAVQSYFTDSLDWTRLDDVAAGYDAELDNIWISQKDRFCLVYNRSSRSWWPQSFIAGAYAYNPDISVSDSVRFIAGGTDSSGLFVRGGVLDDGDSIDAMMQTGYLDYGASQLIKNVKGLRLGYEATRATSWLCESFGQNYTTGATFEVGSFAGSSIAGWSEEQMRFFQGTYRGKRLSHRLTFYNASGLKLPYLQALVKMGVEE